MKIISGNLINLTVLYNVHCNSNCYLTHRTKKHFASVKYSSEITSHNFGGTLTPQGISGAEDQVKDHLVENCHSRPQRT